MTSPVRAPRLAPRPTSRAETQPRFEVYERRPRRSTRTLRDRAVAGPVAAFATVVVFASLLALVTFHGIIAGGPVELDDVNQDVRTERLELSQVQVDLAHLQDPDRITREAEALGMVQASEVNWLSPGSQAPTVTTGGGTADGTDEVDEVDEAPTDQQIDSTSELAATRAAEGEA